VIDNNHNEKSSFNPLVFTKWWDAPMTKVNKRLAEKNNWKMQGAMCIYYDVH